MRYNAKINKFKGPIFELFCKRYFLKIIGVDEAWLIRELPPDLLCMLNLTNKDYGIDIVIKSKGKFSAVQCKFKNQKKLNKKFEMKYHYLNVNWRDLSTFTHFLVGVGL
jgi:predicted helicase